MAHLQQELRQVASKNTAVACYKISSRTEIQLAWIVGSHKQFDSEGNFAFRYTENVAERYQIELSQSLEDIEAEYAQKGIELAREITSLTKPENVKKYNEYLGVL